MNKSKDKFVNQLNQFLVKAKIITYASSGEEREQILPDGGKEFNFEEKEKKRFFANSN